MSKDEALKMAIEAMNKIILRVPLHDKDEKHPILDAINACKEALDIANCDLKQPAQEPVAWMTLNEDGKEITISNSVLLTTQPKWVQDEWLNETTKIPLYTHPHQWQGLTDNEIWAIEAKCLVGNPADWEVEPKRFARAIEQALKEKNT